MTVKNMQRVADSNFDRLQATNGTYGSKNLSQMDKIVTALQMGSKAGPDDAQILAKAEHRVTALKKLREELSAATVAISQLYVVSKPKQLQRLTAALHSVKAIAESKPPVGVAKHLRAALNELTSLREGVYVGAATDKKSLSIINCTEAVAHVDSLIAVAEEKHASLKLTAGPDDALWTDDVARVIEQTNKDAKNLQSLKDKDFVLSRVPVIAVARASNKAATGYLSVEALKRAGLKAESLGGYPVLHNQLVIGINPKSLGLTEAEKDEGKSIPREQWFEAADAVRKLIQRQMKTKLQFVDQKAYGATGGAWFWVMPERELSMFASAFPGKAVSLSNWGLAHAGK